MIRLFSKIINMYNKVYSELKLFRDFIKELQYNDYIVWTKRDDKPLLTVVTEHLVSAVTKYYFYGMCLCFVSTMYFGTPFNFTHVTKSTITYLLLEKVVLMIRKGEK